MVKLQHGHPNVYTIVHYGSPVITAGVGNISVTSGESGALIYVKHCCCTNNYCTHFVNVYIILLCFCP